nr:Ceg14 family Dot/Icm T4SS effector [Legionella norrlandica]
MWDQIVLGNQLAQSICSCDLPSDSEKDAALVKTTQMVADEILEDPTLSWLEKVLKIAIYSRESGFGNCQEKAFFAFALMLNQAQNPDNLIRSLRLATFSNHFILIVNEQFLMDPWLNLAFPISTNNPQEEIRYVFKGFGALIDYFSINENSQCFTHQVRTGNTTQRDIKSEHDMEKCVLLFSQHADLLDLGIKSEEKALISPVKKKKYTSDKNQEIVAIEDTLLPKAEPIDPPFTDKTSDETDDFLEQFERENILNNHTFFSSSTKETTNDSATCYSNQQSSSTFDF